MGELLKIVFGNFIGIDGIIILMAGVNVLLFIKTKEMAGRVYNYFNRTDRTRNLAESARQVLKKTTSEGTKISTEELLDNRDRMNRMYSFYTAITTMFPLMGMFGTVISLIPMVDNLGTAGATGLFFTALTSTFWGILFALIFKFMDAFISYKIEDNEKHMEYLLNPNKQVS